MKDVGYQVHKFGGTSVANAQRFMALKDILTGKHEVVVVSAVQGTTTTLQTILDIAKSAGEFLEPLTALRQMHEGIVKELIVETQQRELIDLIQADCIEIKDILHAVELTHSYSKDIQDIILGYGELWSSKILATYLSAWHHVLYIDASTLLFVYEKNGILCVDWPKSQAALDAFVKNKKFDIAVVTGYIASTEDGKRTTLGRNGSDFSGAIFSKLFKAKCLTIWTDVDGIYTADPTRVRSAFVIESLSYKEALELAYFGAKVLHPMTIAPALENKIPIYIKNSFHPNENGTYISETSKNSPYFIKGLTSIDNIALINIEGSGMIGVSGIASRVFQILHQKNISVILIAQASSEHSICFAVSNSHADEAVDTLQDNLQFEIDRGQIEGVHIDRGSAILSVVGDEMVGAIGVTGKLCGALAKANVNIRAISQGSSERNISVVISSQDLNRALKAVHAGFYLSPETLSIGIIGPGQVGSTLLSQIHQALDHLKSTYQVNLIVRGIMNSSKMLLSHEPINLASWPAQFEQTDVKANLQAFADHIMSNDVPHGVIIDCTANQHIANAYLGFIQKGLDIITPNKHANAGDFAYYKKLKSLTQRKANYYLYEATVCAGLPVINTLQDIIKTGDKVLSIEGIVSGTLSYIFNELAKGRPFSEIVLEAKQRGFTEPDPREDLSGMDVARKLVCLAREIGFETELKDVKVRDLIPKELKSCSLDEFLKKLSICDAEMQKLYETAKAKDERICYVGSISAEGTIQVSLQSVSNTHPFAVLKGTDNMLIFHTNRYREQPLVIQGPGAGAEVTAAGIFADLLRLVSYLS